MIDMMKKMEIKGVHRRDKAVLHPILYKWDELFSFKKDFKRIFAHFKDNGDVNDLLSSQACIYTTLPKFYCLDVLGNELKFFLQVSDVIINPIAFAPPEAVGSKTDHDFLVLFEPSPYEQCARCRMYVEDVGTHLDYHDVCERCFDNIHGKGEDRRAV